MSTLHWGLAATVMALAIVSVAGENVLRRRLTYYRPTQILALGTGMLAGPANIRAALGGFGPDISRLIVALSAAAIIGLLLTYYVHLIRKNRAPQPRRILAIGAHPDDLELAAGGTLARLADSGHEIHAIIMSPGMVGGDPEVRIKEAKGGAAFLGIRSCVVHSFNDTELAVDMTEMIKIIESKIRSFNPDIIFTHSSNDQHQDHHAVHMATVRAGRRHPAILCFESPSATLDFAPKVFVNIDDYVDVKNSAIRIHENQSDKPYMTNDRVAGMAHFRGDQGKLGNAEGFEAVRFDAFKGAI